AEFLVSRAIQKIDMPVEFPDKVLISVDVSGLDPAVFPGMGNPVPGGLGWYQTLSLIDSVVNQTEVIGFDINEFAPLPGFQSYQFAAAMLTYKIMGIIQRSFQSG
ncbi:MAG: arginase family protein, partial [Pseudohongiellaceae bacterium]